MKLPSHLYVGTSSWSSQDWLGSFYPATLKPAQFIQYYATQFPAVEIDSTFYSIPAKSVVSAWREKTPPGFIFAAKVPSVITHQKVLTDCQREFTSFLNAMELLQERLGPLLLQFPYFNKKAFASRDQFEKLLRPFLKALPTRFKFVLELRNKNWISWDFLELLREHSVAFAVVAQAWMPRIDTLARALDIVTGDFCYARFIGDHKGIEAKTQKWGQLVEDKKDEMTVWAQELKKIVARGVRTYAFFNNHYAGFAPGSVKLFEDLWQKV
jgi:uncharacterized protein YecE (DUF72 family)